MRVISGRARNMRLECPTGDDVRPVPEMAREAIFNILREDVADAEVLDLFAGAGTMGIEALSRGAAWCVFVERSPRVRNVLEKNLAHTRLAEFCDVLQRNALTCLPALSRLDRVFDLVFVAPPFPMFLDPVQKQGILALTGELERTGLLRPRARIILQHEKRSGVNDIPPGLALEQQRVYGRNLFNFYVRAGEAEPAPGDDT